MAANFLIITLKYRISLENTADEIIACFFRKPRLIISPAKLGNNIITTDYCCRLDIFAINMNVHSSGRRPRPESGQEKASGGLLQRFDKWVTLNPDRCAILFKNEKVSYGELNKRSLQLATKLKYHGIGLESFVPFCLPKSVHAIVALLAILRCGAAFAAILPSAPRQRKKEIIEACGSKVLVCGHYEKILTEGLCQDQIVVSDEMPDDVEGLAENSKTTRSFPIPSNSNAACVLFTSGSTGSKSPRSLCLNFL